VAERVLLVGMMGSGKSTVAPMVAQRLGWRWIDTDDEVERATGMSIAQLFETRGEESFRNEESRALAACLEMEEPSVVSVGGGAVLDEQNRHRMRSGAFVVWLRASPMTLFRRVGSIEGRPLLAGDALAVLERLEAQRDHFYDEVSEEVIDTDHMDAEQVAALVVQRRLDPSGARSAGRDGGEGGEGGDGGKGGDGAKRRAGVSSNRVQWR
jgi:shikimate kinase